MTAVVALNPAAPGWLDAYSSHVAGLAIGASPRAARVKAARRLDDRADGDVALWMGRPTGVRLAELHRTRAWPYLSWLLVTGCL